MTQEEMGRALDAANRKLAAVTIAARLAGTVDSDYAQIEGEKHAGAVRFNERGDLDETSLAAIVKEVLSHAPAKFRRDDKSSSPQHLRATYPSPEHARRLRRHVRRLQSLPVRSLAGRSTRWTCSARLVNLHVWTRHCARLANVHALPLA